MKANLPESTSSNPPMVFISYSKKDVKWKDNVRQFLKPSEKSGRIFVWDHEQAAFSSEWDAVIEGALEQTRVAVLLISSDYLASEFVAKEIPQLLERRDRGELRLFPVLIRPCQWEKFDWLSRMQLFPKDGKPLESGRGEVRERLMTELANEIVRVAVEEAARNPPAERATEQATKANARSFIRPTPPDPAPPSVDPSPLRTEPPTSDSEPNPPGEWPTAAADNILFKTVLAKFDLYDEVKEIFLRAAKLATLAEGQPSSVTTSCLLFAIAESGRESSRFFRTPQFFWKELSEKGTDAYLRALADKFPRATYRSTDGVIDYNAIQKLASAITPNALGVLSRAAEISRATLTRPPVKSSEQTTPGAPDDVRPGRISARHMLAALLVYEPEIGSIGATTRLKKLVDIERLRGRFFGFIVKALPDDDPQAWRAVLGLNEGVVETTAGSGEDIDVSGTEETSGAEEATGDAPVADDDIEARLAGFLTDYWYGADLLDITPDVNALASLVAAWSVEPPLSIGLFGDWGSGKTHFMRQMKARVALLSRQARASKRAQNKIGYYKNIVQIEFNAWHYIEGNLWASLVEHIFAHLKLSDKESSTLTDARREALMEKLGVKKQIQARVDERKEQLKTKETEARGRADDARKERDGASYNLQLLRGGLKSSILEQFNLPIKFSEEQQKLLKQLGISSASLTSAAEVHKKYEESKSIRQRLRAQWALFRNEPRQWKRWVVALALLLIPMLVAVSLPLIYKRLTSDDLSKARAALASGVTFLLTLLVSAKPYWEKLQKGLKTLREKHDEIEEERQKLIVELETEVSALTMQYKDAEREAEVIKRQVTELETELAGTTAGKILAEFIEDRAAASDYRRHLGVLALIRRDFEKLAALFSEQREEERKGNGAVDDHTINRIILYIDDLDRCPPDRVVQVLQAIHLLLAFPLFVVVVGVDARWVTRSLQESYEWLRIEEEEDAKNGKPAVATSKVQGATPHDYLEKIFQIPFWLKPMEDKACKNFLDGLTKDSLIGAEAESNGDADAKDEVVLLRFGHPADQDTVDAEAANARQQSAQGSPSALPPAPPLGDEHDETGPQADAGEKASGVNTGAGPDASKGAASVNGAAGDEQANAQTAGAQGKAAADEEDEDEAGEDLTIDLEPQSLKLREEEVSYMKELTPLIGRSPRAVKRFLNCYRLIKVGLRPAQLVQFIGADGQSGEYKAVMILLGVITGAPPISLYFIEELEKLFKSYSDGTPDELFPSLHDFLAQLDKNPEIIQQPDWARVKGLLEAHVRWEDSTETLKKLIAVAPRVSRYSFRVARVEAARQKKPQARVQKTAPARENIQAKV